MLKQLVKLDTQLSWRFTLASDSAWRQWATLLAHVGDGPYVFGGLGLVYMLSWLLNDPLLRSADLSVALEVFAAMALVTLIKFTIRRQRPRPPGEFVSFHYDIYSFPSGHSARLAALAMGTVLVYPILGGFLWLVTLTVAAARVVVGVHYVSDIVAGLGLGILVALLVSTLLPLLPIPLS